MIPTSHRAMFTTKNKKTNGKTCLLYLPGDETDKNECSNVDNEIGNNASTMRCLVISLLRTCNRKEKNG